MNINMRQEAAWMENKEIYQKNGSQSWENHGVLWYCTKACDPYAEYIHIGTVVQQPFQGEAVVSIKKSK